MNDWSTHLINVEKLLRSIEDKLLHKRHEGVEEEIYDAIGSLHRTIAWVKSNPDK